MIEKSKYKSLSDWRSENYSAYNAACRLNLLDKISETFGWKRKKKNKPEFTKEECLSIALKYEYKNQWLKGHQQSYNYALKMNWYDECTKHMKKYIKQNPWRDKEKVISEAKKFNSLSEWRRNSQNSYCAACKNNWLEECKQNFTTHNQPLLIWHDKELCYKEALKYKTISEWYLKSKQSYSLAYRKNWMVEFTQHMDRPYKKRD